MALLINHSDAHTCSHPHTPTYTHANTARSKGMILINSENCLVRGLPYTSHLSCLLESGSTLIVLKWGCINDVNPLKISSGLWGVQDSAVKEKWETKHRQTERYLDGQIGSHREWLSHCMDSLMSPFHTFFLPSVALISSTHLHLSAVQTVIIAWKIYI